MARNISQAISYIFTWETSHDERVCPICAPLNGREYRNQDLFQRVLVDPIVGALWDLDADHTLAHPNCRCQIAVTVIVDWSKIDEIYKLSKGGLAVGMYSRAPGTSIAELRQQVVEFDRDVEVARKHVGELNRLLTIHLALSRRLGLPEPVEDFVNKFVRAKLALDAATRSIQLFYATSGPLGWALLIGGLALSGLMLADSFEMRMPEY